MNFFNKFAQLQKRRGQVAPLPRVIIAVLLLIVLAGILAPLIVPCNPYNTDLGNKFASPSLTHLLGTDHLGRDYFSRLVMATRMSLLSILMINILILGFSLTIGCISAYRGGVFDAVLMRVCDVFLTFPTFVLALFFIGVFGTGLSNVIIAIAFTHWAWYARIVRSLVLEYKNKNYILAAKTTGSTKTHIIFRHILPPVVAQILILATLDLGHMLLHVAGLSFLGLGVQAPTPEWGVMISDAAPYIRDYPEYLIYPGLCIFIVVVLFNSLGEFLRDKLDPAIASEA